MITASGKLSKQETCNQRGLQDAMETCMPNIKHWMDTMQLKMCPSKLNHIFWKQDSAKEVLVNDLNIAGDLVLRSHTIRYLGAHLDENLNYKLHVNKKCQVAMFNYFKIRSIRNILDVPTTMCLCLSLCISHLDYCNSLLYGLPEGAEGAEYVCTLSIKKNKVGQYHRMPQRTPLATNQTKNIIQNPGAYP